ncbi:YheT family hydrolase [Pseudodesulfovibrio senegalensis]|uniref:Alpha/beta fold hydrolase n=1 Tax=Pseudodesulfovibrio senegalensis TaxID=1721087 RepID=A0A6N6N5H9_9BACT|nr:alpha/beta fold hydrolase [Pseudodesulfovibrio senegalensis]KAB1443296.1 alpha/beta fold hydrolase [Pseudodesulfovibrio senegalensis]
MPILPASDYRAPFPFGNGHVQTLYPTLLRPTPQTAPRRERIATPDNDFIDIDHHAAPHPTDHVAVISHGLEGNSRKKYPLGMAKALNQAGWDAVCLNFRGCSGEPNLTMRTYHSGVTDDLHTVLTHVLKTGGYARAALIGFSMGGNQTLKYLGEAPDNVPEQVAGAVAFSVPCDLSGSSTMLERPSCRIYMEYFMRDLRRRVRVKNEQFPGRLDLSGLDAMITFREFDDRYTAPMHGFRDAEDYYAQSSCLAFLPNINVPTLLVNALNDPFLSPACFPREHALANPDLHLETPATGGHVGFVRFAPDGQYWSEQRATAFLHEYAS